MFPKIVTFCKDPFTPLNGATYSSSHAEKFWRDKSTVAFIINNPFLITPLLFNPVTDSIHLSRRASAYNYITFTIDKSNPYGAVPIYDSDKSIVSLIEHDA